MKMPVHNSILVTAALLIAFMSHSGVFAQDTELSPPTEILQTLQAGDLEAALQQLGALADQGISVGDLIYSSLPAAAGGLHRSLAQLSADEQYELLERWTLPDGDRKDVRLLAVPVPTDAPPKLFARSLGERPKDTTFIVPSVGPVPGFFCNGWMLAKAADDLGRLARLRATLEQLVEAHVDGAEQMLMLAQLAGSRGQMDRVQTYLQQSIEADDAVIEIDSQDLINAAIASGAISHEQLQPFAETMLSKLVDRGGIGQGVGLRPFLRIAHATAIQVHRGESPPETLFQNRLKYWTPATVRSAQDIERGQPRAVWLTHEQHVLHLAGGRTDVLFCRFPLVGEFDFVCETQEGGDIGTDGGLVYGGLHFQALGRKDTLQVWDADISHTLTKPSPFARHDSKPVFNRVSIRSTQGEPKFESNFHPVWFDDIQAEASPWIGLRSSGSKRPVFRNFRLTGNPTIPHEVQLTSGDSLRGWQSGFFAETQPSFQIDQEADESASYDWQLKAAELVGAQQEDEQEAAKPGLLQYQRPLLEDEAITFQFMHQGDDSIVSPSIGRLAFLLEATGVRVRWITTGDSEWTGLKPDNAALEPLNRRGPRPLPLQEGEWNTVRVECADDKVLIKLNEQLIYQRPAETGSGSQFGFYRPSRGSAIRIRNVVMTGDWPKTVPEEFTKEATAYSLP